MQEADMSMTNMAMAAGTGQRQGDETLLVKFMLEPMKSNTKSKEAGRPIFIDVDWIEVMQPGNKDSIIKRVATPQDKNRFPEHFRKYKAREDQEAVEGTLLSEWPGVGKSQCEELKFFNIRTIEQLIGMSGSNMQGIMGINGLQEKAKKYLEASNVEAAAEALLAAEARNTALEETVARLTARLDVMEEITSEAPVKRKRRTKAQMEADSQSA
jgi:hypothetical protein